MLLRYDGMTADELSFPKDAILELVQTSYDGWPTLKYKNHIGRAPLILLEIWNQKKENRMRNEGLRRTLSTVSRIHIQPKIEWDDIGESSF